ncbi:hypothetical protein SNE40_018164 [Patella caerulea]|uniref:Uncharacterized protein n=1 Tax=Patella caerulea TaxID=87958 RepID=A0AAN8J966_PATCE
MESNQIPWENLVCFAADNAAVMLGSKKGVAAFITEMAPAVYIAGCSCHLIHLAVQKDQLLVDIFYYLEKSSKRKQALKANQEQEGLPQHKILKHVSTRWLSLEHCLDRLLEQWPALMKFYEAEVEGEKKETNRKRPASSEEKVQHGKYEKRRRVEQVQQKSTQRSTSVAEVKNTSSKADTSSKEFDLANFMFKQREVADKAKKHKEASRAAADKQEPSTVSTQSSSKASLILTKMTNKNTLLFTYFLMGILPTFNETNTFLQKDSPSSSCSVHTVQQDSDEICETPGYHRCC